MLNKVVLRLQILEVGRRDGTTYMSKEVLLGVSTTIKIYKIVERDQN